MGDLLNHLSPGVTLLKNPPSWPPDVFALVAAILKKSGAYCSVLEQWQQKSRQEELEWPARMRLLGGRWRQAWVSRTSLPTSIVQAWHYVLKVQKTLLANVGANKRLCRSLLCLCAAADEASVGVGIPVSNPAVKMQSRFTLDHFQLQADKLLLPTEFGSTLCDEINDSNVRVLPKTHTPQSGLTIRSFTNNLALCPSGEIQPEWYSVPVNTQERSLNLLLVPWPERVTPARFVATRPPSSTSTFVSGHSGLFTFTEGEETDLRNPILNLLKEAEKQVGRIDGVVLPELALSDRQHTIIAPKILERSAFLVAGLGRPAKRNAPGENYLCFDLPIGGRDFMVSLQQRKHHRWRLDKYQIMQYGLGTNLDPESEWWEHISLVDRKLMFVAMRPWLTMAALICEDLARPDPAADLVRAVGPNLVIALLMDGPQLAQRWSGRYAAGLADDPGSSVLSVTSRGMSKLSRPRAGAPRSNVVALWKDAQSGVPVEIELPSDASALVINITVNYREEWTADGRSDSGTTGYPILSGLHPVGLNR
jgi:hypothetical protein